MGMYDAVIRNAMHSVYGSTLGLSTDHSLVFIALCNTFLDSSWRMEPRDGYFTAGITTDKKVYTYVFHVKYWDSFKCKIVERIPGSVEGEKNGF